MPASIAPALGRAPQFQRAGSAHGKTWTLKKPSSRTLPDSPDSAEPSASRSRRSMSWATSESWHRAPSRQSDARHRQDAGRRQAQPARTAAARSAFRVLCGRRVRAQGRADLDLIKLWALHQVVHAVHRTQAADLLLVVHAHKVLGQLLAVDGARHRARARARARAFGLILALEVGERVDRHPAAET